MSQGTFTKSNAVVPFARGAYKTVWRGHMSSGPLQGQESVLKAFAGDPVIKEHYLEVREALFQKAQQIVNAWNDANITDRRVVLRHPQVVYDPTSGGTCLAEPLIPDFQKFNSNTGWEAPQGEQYSGAMEALSHFSYVNSGGMMVLCDIQGSISQNEVVLSDPAILSRFESYGPADLGTLGIDAFFARHQCNQYCNPRWTKPARLPRPAQIPMRQGTTMTRQRPGRQVLSAVV